ncbi:hypothetical protein I5907_09385 [Panacibacter sp. DH6]|uniref:Tetratricopeptide repeat protein n=1 Tax=Panacibacter microcysteis TaxID=2793269 RepID=A0A931E704_9BACT|nr:hypothetical protein [Panacibacter microcysteis]MBG9376445.1 hypothetical protein [Panacibacter microcysteis]
MRLLLTALLAVLFLSFTYVYNRTYYSIHAAERRFKATKQKKLLATGCAPGIAAIDFRDPVNEIPLMKGWGVYRMPVTAGNDSANIYFQQGINMYYGFHIIESIASFEKALKFDDSFAMAYWGKALAYGPNINDLGYAASPEALSATTKAKALYANNTPVEKALIDAMQTRYAVDTTLSRIVLNQHYADAMKTVHLAFPESQDAAALYADALMVQHPWDFYTHDGKPKPWTPEIVTTLEKLVAVNPQHSGAIHYYIHAVEASDHPEKAVTAAKTLPGLAPGLAHMVHMPSHIFIRSGYYHEGVQVNEDAIKSYRTYEQEYAPATGAMFLYLLHNLHMEAACAQMTGSYTTAISASNQCHNAIDSASMAGDGYFGVYAQYLYMTPVFTMIRFGKADEILSQPAIPGQFVYANLLWHFARGYAYTRKHDTERAKDELAALRLRINDPQLQDHPPAFNAAIAGTALAEKLLEGLIDEEDGDMDKAVEHFTMAMGKEDDMLYNEPRDWLLPVRQYLGSALLKTGKYREAEKVFLEDLEQNPNNGWSLNGLATSLLLQGKLKESTKIQQQAKLAFSKADIKITVPVF